MKDEAPAVRPGEHPPKRSVCRSGGRRDALSPQARPRNPPLALVPNGERGKGALPAVGCDREEKGI